MIAGNECPWSFRLPDGWELLQRWGDGYACRQKGGGMAAIIDCSVKADGHWWLHLSVSRKSWNPTHDDMCAARKAFLGESGYAYAVHPPAMRYVNIHPHCLHLWQRADGSAMLPDFDEIVEGVGRSI